MSFTLCRRARRVIFLLVRGGEVATDLAVVEIIEAGRAGLSPVERSACFLQRLSGRAMSRLQGGKVEQFKQAARESDVEDVATHEPVHAQPHLDRECVVLSTFTDTTVAFLRRPCKCELYLSSVSLEPESIRDHALVSHSTYTTCCTHIVVHTFATL